MIIDTLGHEYGWTKAEILSLYPREIQILQEQIARRREDEEDAALYRAIIAARTPHTKDGGAEILKTIKARHMTVNDASDVTAETIARDLKRARMMMGLSK